MNLTQLENLSKQLKSFEYNLGDNATDKIARYLLYLHVFLLEFTNEEDLLREARKFLVLIYYHNDKTKKPTHWLIADCLDNEVARRKEHPTKGLKFPSFLEEDRNLSKLVKYLYFLLTGEGDVLNKDTKKAEEIAKQQAYKLYLDQLDYLYTKVSYKGNISN